MSDVTIVEVFGIKMEDRCASLLRIVADSNVNWDLRTQALGKLGKAGCTRALEYIVKNSNINWDLRQTALRYL
jgi:predicted transcriptional regulator